MQSRIDMIRTLIAVILAAALALPAQAGDRLLYGTRQRDENSVTDNKVQHHSLAQRRARSIDFGLERKSPWSLPTKALDEPLDTIEILVMRFNFQKEETNDPNTTCKGEIDLSRPLAN